MASFSDCHGCSLCLLSCPMWRQYRDVRHSPQGIAKARQHGGSAADMVEVLSSCIMCGACDVLCPEKIDLTSMMTTSWLEAGIVDHEMSPKIKQDYFAMSCSPLLANNLDRDDLYIIDPLAFHAHHAERVGHYDGLRQTTGCSMNLDLNRMAMATGIGSLASAKQCFDVKKQVEWIIQGRKFQRVVVENPAEQKIFSEISG
ncbi:MAG: (Fe-S)-binding protein, partial [Mariprofundaceae bacterium]